MFFEKSRKIKKQNKEKQKQY